jgi:hypothetical protein
VAYSYGGWGLNNSSDTIILYDYNSNEVDRVEYSSPWGVPDGASLSLQDPTLDNNKSFYWCKETSAWVGSAGDKGTPGQPAGCP